MVKLKSSLRKPKSAGSKGSCMSASTTSTSGHSWGRTHRWRYLELIKDGLKWLTGKRTRSARSTVTFSESTTIKASEALDKRKSHYRRARARNSNRQRGKAGRKASRKSTKGKKTRGRKKSTGWTVAKHGLKKAGKRDNKNVDLEPKIYKPEETLCASKRRGKDTLVFLVPINKSSKYAKMVNKKGLMAVDKGMQNAKMANKKGLMAVDKGMQNAKMANKKGLMAIDKGMQNAKMANKKGLMAVDKGMQNAKMANKKGLMAVDKGMQNAKIAKQINKNRVNVPDRRMKMINNKKIKNAKTAMIKNLKSNKKDVKRIKMSHHGKAAKMGINKGAKRPENAGGSRYKKNYYNLAPGTSRATNCFRHDEMMARPVPYVTRSVSRGLLIRAASRPNITEGSSSTFMATARGISAYL